MEWLLPVTNPHSAVTMLLISVPAAANIICCPGSATPDLRLPLCQSAMSNNLPNLAARWPQGQHNILPATVTSNQPTLTQNQVLGEGITATLRVALLYFQLHPRFGSDLGALNSSCRLPP